MGGRRRGGEELGRRTRRRRRRWSVPLGDRPTRGARTSIRAALLAAEPSSLLAMSQSRHRAAAPPLEREDSGTFRSARGRSGPRLAGPRGVGGRGGAGEPGSPAALWVKPLPDALAPAAAGGPAGARTRPRWRASRGLRLGPAPSASSGVGAGPATVVRGLPGK